MNESLNNMYQLDTCTDLNPTRYGFGVRAPETAKLCCALNIFSTVIFQWFKFKFSIVFSDKNPFVNTINKKKLNSILQSSFTTKKASPDTKYVRLKYQGK